MTAERSPLEQALDLVLYGPVGLAVTAGESRAEIVDKGRQRVAAQVGMARVIGQFAVAQGEKEARKVFDRVLDALRGSPSAPADTPPASPPAAPSPSAPPAHRKGTSGRPRAGQPVENGSARAEGAGVDALPVGPARSSAHLAIPGYDTLSAPQVVQRLAGLAPEELAAVGAYEEATRGRRTILSRVAQLRADKA